MPTILEVLQESLEALKAGGFPAGGDVYDNLAQAIKQLKAGDNHLDKLRADNLEQANRVIDAAAKKRSR